MQKFGVLGQFINPNGKNGNAHNIHDINNHYSRKNKDQSRFQIFIEGQHERHKKNNNAYGITTFNDARYKLLIKKKVHCRKTGHRGNAGAIPKSGNYRFTLKSHKSRNIIRLRKFIAAHKIKMI